MGKAFQLVFSASIPSDNLRQPLLHVHTEGTKLSNTNYLICIPWVGGLRDKRAVKRFHVKGTITAITH